MAITPVPSMTDTPEFPSLADRAAGTYNSKAYDFGTHMANVFNAELLAVALSAYNNALAAAQGSTDAGTYAANAAAAAASAAATAGATKWVSGSYAEGAAVWSPTDGQTYRRKAPGGASPTDPAADSTNWNFLGGVASVNGQKGAVTGIATTTANTFTGRQTMSGAAIDQAKGANIASAATVNLDTATGNLVHITGTTTITAITLASGAERDVVFDGALLLTHNATTLILPGGANITTAAGDRATFRGDGSGNVRCMHYTKANGQPIVAPASTSGLVLISTASASGVAAIDFTGIDSTYDEYMVEILSAIPASAAVTLQMLASSDNGASFSGGGTAYKWAMQGYGTNGSGLANSSDGSNLILLSNAINGGSGASFSIRIVRPSVAQPCDFFWTGCGNVTSNYLHAYQGAGRHNASVAVNAIRFYFSSGNIASGLFKLYGLRKTV